VTNGRNVELFRYAQNASNAPSRMAQARASVPQKQSPQRRVTQKLSGMSRWGKLGRKEGEQSHAHPNAALPQGRFRRDRSRDGVGVHPSTVGPSLPSEVTAPDADLENRPK
jgi:hypothetical protein